MRKIILVSLGLLLFTSSFAQPYKSYFGEQYTKWYMFHNGCEWFSYSFFLSNPNKTEEIDGITYQCLYREKFNGSIVSIPENVSKFGTWLREDKNTGQLFFRQKEFDYIPSEILVSDMSLEVGDSIRLYNSIWTYDVFWENVLISEDNIPYAIVDSVYYKDELKHVRTSALFHNTEKYNGSSYINDTLMFIESIGSNITPLLDIYFYEWNCGNEISVSMCYETENKLVHFTDEDYCFWYVEKINQLKKLPLIREEIKDGFLNLFFEQPISGQINLLDISGKVLYNEQIISNEFNHNIYVGKFAKGIYVLQIKSINNELFNNKIIIF